MTMAAYNETRSRYCKNYIRQIATVALFLCAAVILYKTFLSDDNTVDVKRSSSLGDNVVNSAQNANDNVKEMEKPVAAVPGKPGGKDVKRDGKPADDGKTKTVGANPLPVSSAESEKMTLKQKTDECIKFRTTVLQKNVTTMCNQGINRDGMQAAIMADSDPFKHKIIATYGMFMKMNKEQIVSIEVGCGTGAITLLSSLSFRKSIAVDPHIDNLKVLQRGLKLTKMSPRVKQLWYSVSNTSALKPDFSWTPGEERRITLDDVMGHYMVPKELILITLANGGYELEALQGATGLLTNTRICYILVDFSNKRTQDTGEEIVKLLGQHGLLPYSDIHKTKWLSTVPPKQYRLGVAFMTSQDPPCKIPNAPPAPPPPKEAEPAKPQEAPAPQPPKPAK